jgi:hypothetical protein
VTAPHDDLSQVAVVLAPATVLRRLADSGSTGEAAEVSVHLSGGQVLGGLPVRVGTDHGQEVVLMASANGGQLGYALLANVVAVEVRDPERFQDILTEGRLPQPATGEPITRLALRRDFSPSEGFPVQVDWAAQPESGPAMANLDRLLRGLREIAREVCADEMGRQTWAQVRALHVSHRDGVKLSVQQVPDGLSVQADMTAALPRDLTGELSRQINASL